MSTNGSQSLMQQQHECGPFQFSDPTARDGSDRHIAFDHVVALENATHRVRYEEGVTVAVTLGTTGEGSGVRFASQ